MDISIKIYFYIFFADYLFGIIEMTEMVNADCIGIRAYSESWSIGRPERGKGSKLNLANKRTYVMLIPNNEIVRTEPLYGSGQELYSDPFNSRHICFSQIFFIQ